MKTASIPAEAQRWLAQGERGISSETIFEAMTGLKICQYRPDIPYDPADFRRCRLLIEAVPEWRKRLPEITNLCPAWRPFVEAWDELCLLMDAECPEWRSGKGKAPKLYERMSELRGLGKRT